MHDEDFARDARRGFQREIADALMNDFPRAIADYGDGVPPLRPGGRNSNAKGYAPADAGSIRQPSVVRDMSVRRINDDLHFLRNEKVRKWDNGRRFGAADILSPTKYPVPILYRIYRSSLETYTRKLPSGSRYCRWYEAFIRWLALLLAFCRRFSFPERTTGGWWWIWRWRFEVLMGWYELACAAVCRKYIRCGDTVLDVGGHIGLHSRLFSRLVGPQGRVLVFEANPENVAVLRRNLRGRRYRNVEVIWAAVSAADGEAPLFISPGHSNHSLLQGYTAATDVIQAPTISIDSYLERRGIRTVDFVKSDTEGAEPLVIQGMEKILRNSPEIKFLMEYNPAALRCGDISPERFTAMLELRGFEVKAIQPDGTLSGIPILKENEYTNILCWKRLPDMEPRLSA